MLIPYGCGALLLVLLPALLIFALAFTTYDGLAAPQWVGDQTFQDVRFDPVFPSPYTIR